MRFRNKQIIFSIYMYFFGIELFIFRKRKTQTSKKEHPYIPTFYGIDNRLEMGDRYIDGVLHKLTTDVPPLPCKRLDAIKHSEGLVYLTEGGDGWVLCKIDTNYFYRFKFVELQKLANGFLFFLFLYL